MDWSYIAGLFDGEGSIVLSLSGRSIRLQINFVVSNDEIGDILMKWFLEREITFRKGYLNNKLGKGIKLGLTKWLDIEKFLNNIESFVVIKTPQINIAKQCIELHKNITIDLEDSIVNHLKEFDDFRHQLHSLAQKGPKNLTEWNYFR